MPKIFHPRRSDAHRIACLALYRALFKECNHLTTRLTLSESSAPLKSLQSLIRYRFRRDARLQSPYAIRDALTRGQSHLSLLHDASTGSSAAVTTLTSIIESTLSHAASTAAARAAQKEQLKPPAKKHLAKIRHQRNEATKANHVPGPTSVPVTSLPLPLEQLRQPKRQVPNLNDVQGRIAILRWPGQHRYPVFVSRVTRQKLKRVERLHGSRMELESLVEMGKAEDQWDKSINDQIQQQAMHGEKGPEQAHLAIEQMVDNQTDGSWASEAKRALRELEGVIKKMEQERGQRGAFLWDIIKKEKKLSEWETLPERLVRAAINARKLYYDLMGLAKSRGRDALAERLYEILQERKERELREEEELMKMYWVIPVDLVKDFYSPERPPSAAATPSLLAPASRPMISNTSGEESVSEQVPARHDFSRGWQKRMAAAATSASPATTFTGPPTSHPWRQQKAWPMEVRDQIRANVGDAPPSYPKSLEAETPPKLLHRGRTTNSSKQPSSSSSVKAASTHSDTLLPPSHPRRRSRPVSGVDAFKRTLDKVQLADFSPLGDGDDSRKGKEGRTKR